MMLATGSRLVSLEFAEMFSGFALVDSTLNGIAGVAVGLCCRLTGHGGDAGRGVQRQVFAEERQVHVRGVHAPNSPPVISEEAPTNGRPETIGGKSHNIGDACGNRQADVDLGVKDPGIVANPTCVQITPPLEV